MNMANTDTGKTGANYFRQLQLFDPSDFEEAATSRIPSDISLPPADDTLLFMTLRVSMTSRYEMPIVAPLAFVSFTDILAYHRLKRVNAKCILPHFYVCDKKIKQAFSNPMRTLEKLSQFDASISMDFSMTQEMSRPQKMYSSFLNKLWAAWLQSYGLNVVPNVSWPDEVEQDYWLEGWPKESVISVSSVGISHGDPAIWLRGMERVRETLKPTTVIRYGSKIPGETEDNCIYIKNDNNRLANGRQQLIQQDAQPRPGMETHPS